MLAHNSVQISSRNQLTALGADANDFGITTPPANFLVPQFIITPAAIGQRNWRASVQITRPAYEGDNAAYHIGPGMHSTDLMFSGGALTNYVAGAGNRRIYVEVSAGISNDACYAEEEHCADMRYAYSITLQAMQNALTAAVLHGPYQGFNMVDAMRAAKLAISNGLHQRLQAILRASDIPTGGVNMGTFSSELGKLYLAKCDMSQQRDAYGWHFFEPDRTGESWSGRSWAEYVSAKAAPSSVHQYWAGDIKDIRKAVRGPQFSVNVHQSNQVVTL